MTKKHFYALFLGLLTLCVFGKILSHNFVLWDDNRNIYDNPHLVSEPVRNIPEFWAKPYAGLYIPVTYTAWSFIAAVSGSHDNVELGNGVILNATFFHAANLLTHLASVLLVFLILIRLLPRECLHAAALGAAIFAIHPLQVEAVAWATGLKDLLSNLLGLGSVFLFIHRVPQAAKSPGDPGAPRSPLYPLSLMCFLLAVLAKPSAVVFAPILFLIDMGVRRNSLRDSLVALIPFLAAAIAITAITIAAQPQSALAFPPPEVALWKKPIVALDSVAFYLSKLIFPANFSVDYSRTPDFALSPLRLLSITLVPALFLVLVVRAKKNRRLVIVATGLFLLALLPVSGIISFAYQGISTVSDRYAYLAMLGVGLGIAAWLSVSRYRAAPIATLALIGVLSFISFHETSRWKTTTSLFEKTLKSNPNSVIAHYNLGIVLANQDRLPEALDHYRAAIALKPEFSLPYNNLAKLQNEAGQFGESIPLLRKALAINPNDPLPHTNLALAYAKLNRFEEAADHYRRAHLLNPEDADTAADLGYALANLSRFEEAVQRFQKAIQIDPTLSPAYSGLGKVYLALNEFDAAAKIFKELIQLEPGNPLPHSLLAKAHEGGGASQLAKAASLRALALAKESPDSSPTLIRDLENELLRYEKSTVDSPGRP